MYTITLRNRYISCSIFLTETKPISSVSVISHALLGLKRNVITCRQFGPKYTLSNSIARRNWCWQVSMRHNMEWFLWSEANYIQGHHYHRRNYPDGDNNDTNYEDNDGYDNHNMIIINNRNVTTMIMTRNDDSNNRSNLDTIIVSSFLKCLSYYR